MIKQAKQLIKEKNVKQISPTMFKVLDHSVKFQIKKGRTIIICSCENSSYFGNNNFCIHKLSAIVYLTNKDLDKHLNKLISSYKKVQKLGLKVDCDLILDDLQRLRDLK